MDHADRALTMIQNGRPLREIALQFPVRGDGYLFYAEQMASKHSAGGAECCSCGKQDQATEAAFGWSGNVESDNRSSILSIVAMFFGILIVNDVRVKFRTVHTICKWCRWRLALKRIARELIEKALFAILILSLIVVVPLTVLAVYSIYADRALLLRFVAALLAGSTVLGCCLWCRARSRLIGVPNALREIAKSPFRLESIKPLQQ